MALSRGSTVQVTFKVDGDGNVRAAFAGLATDADKATDKVNQYSQAADGADKSQQRLATSAKLAGAALGTAIVGSLVLLTRNTIQAQHEQAQLEAVLRSTGNAAGYSAKQMNEMAASLAANSVFSAGEITDAQTRLLSYTGIVGENIPRAMQIVIDQGQRLGISLTQSAETIGRALESPTKAAAALAQQGFGAAFTDSVRNAIENLEDAGRTAEAQAIVMEILEESYDGAAAAARDTLGGALASLKNAIMDVMTGDAGVDGLTGAVNDLTAAINDPDVRAGFASIVEGLANTATAAVLLTSELSRAWEAAQRWTTFKLGGVGDVTQLKQIRYEIEQLEGSVAGWSDGGIKEFLAQPDIDAARKRLEELRDLERQSLMLFGDPDKPAMRFIDPTDAGSLGEDRHLRAERVDQLGLDFDADDAAKAAAKAAAEARRAGAAAAREAAAAERELERAQAEAERQARALTAAQDDSLAMLEDLRAEMAGPAAMAVLQYSRMERDLDLRVAEGAMGWEAYAEAMELVHQKRTKALADIESDLQETGESLSVYADQAARNMQSAFSDTLFDFFRIESDGMAADFANALTRMYTEYITSQFFQAVMGGGSGGYGETAGGLVDLFMGSGFGFAKGGALPASPSLSAYSGTVVDKPTAFMFAKGGALGVMGEVQGESEGIFPLKRGRDGRLGVAAEISGTGGTVVEIHNYSSEGARTERGTAPDGREMIRVVIGEVARDLAQGGMVARAGEGAYGWNRRGVSSG